MAHTAAVARICFTLHPYVLMKSLSNVAHARRRGRRNGRGREVTREEEPGARNDTGANRLGRSQLYEDASVDTGRKPSRTATRSRSRYVGDRRHHDAAAIEKHQVARAVRKPSRERDGNAPRIERDTTCRPIESRSATHHGIGRIVVRHDERERRERSVDAYRGRLRGLVCNAHRSCGADQHRESERCRGIFAKRVNTRFWQGHPAFTTSATMGEHHHHTPTPPPAAVERYPPGNVSKRQTSRSKCTFCR